MAEETEALSPVNEAEMELLKKTFTGNEELLKTMRALFFGLGISDAEKKIIKDTFSSKELMKILWTRFSPKLSRDSEIGQIQDVWLGAEQMVFGQSPNVIEQAVMYKEQAIQMTEKALSLLQDPDGDQISLDYSPVLGDDLQIGLLARNQFIRHVEKQLLYIWLIAEQGNTDQKDIMKRLEQNSSK